MNTPVAAALRFSLIFLVSAVAYADSAQWNLNPGSSDWNTATNWTPMTVPNSPADIATFALSNTTNVSISADTEVNAMTFTPGASSFTFAAPRASLTLSGAGITNNSGTIQNFVTANPNGLFLIEFANNARAGSQAVFTNEGGGVREASPGLIFFGDTSTADNATFFNNGSTVSDTNGGNTHFFGTSTAANGTFTNNGGAAIGLFPGGGTAFHANSTADNATFTNNGGTVSDAGGGYTVFYDSSTADAATLIANDGIDGGLGGTIFFAEDSIGGTSRIELFGESNLDIRFHNAPGVTIGSIEGDESSSVFLRANNLTVGNNNLSTPFFGVIQDEGFGGSLTKIGKGTLDLTGANTYTGNTNINGGVLQVDGSISSDTFVNRGGTLAGSGTVKGNITNLGGKISPRDASGVPGVLTVGGNYATFASQIAGGGTVSIQIGGGADGQVSVLNVHGHVNLGGFLEPVLVNGFVPKIGQSFTFLNYASFTGRFGIRNPVFDHGRKRWSVSYGATSAVLTAVGNPRP
jgi:autotransporter-associated beta strand protein